MATGLKVIGGPARGSFFELRTGTFVIGRDATNTIQLESHMVSRRHAEIRLQPDQAIIKDLGSANGTIVNGRQVDEQELTAGDRIFIGDFILEFVANPVGSQQLSHNETRGNIDVGAKRTHDTPGLLPTVDWKVKALLLLVGVLLVDHLLVAKLFINKIKADVTTISLKRARDITRYLAEKNKGELARGNETLLDTETVLGEEGVVAAFIANKKARVLAPSYKLNQVLADETSRAALQLGKDEIVSSSRLKGGLYRFATPIRSYNDELGEYETIGVALVLFAPKNILTTMEAVRKIWLLSFLFVAIASLLLFIGLRQITLPPITYVAEKIGLLFRGEVERIERHSSISALRPLIDAVNAAAVRLKEGELHTPSFVQPTNNNIPFSSDEELDRLIAAIPDAALLLDGSGTILALNERAQAFLQAAPETVLGSDLDKIVTDDYLRTFFVESIAELKMGKEGMIVKSLQYGDFSYQVSLHAIRQDPEQLKWAIIIERA